MNRTGRAGLLVPLMFVVNAAAGHGQTAGVTGVVRDTMGRALDGVEVVVAGINSHAVTGADGRFSLTGLHPGRGVLQVRRIGYRPTEIEITLAAQREETVEIRLVAQTVVLPEIEVKGRNLKPSRYATTAKYDDFFRHQRSGFGTFITRDQIDRMNAFHTADILRSVPGFNVTFRDADPTTAQVRMARCSGRSARINVYIDGTLQRVRDSVESPMGGIGSLVSVALAGISAPHIEMMEVFRGAAEIPGEFDSGNACAVIAIWTRWNR